MQNGTLATKVPTEASYDDAEVIRQILVQSIKRSGLSRAAIADRMSYLLHRSVTEKMLNAFTGERDDRRWPAEFDRAFCTATNDLTLILDRARRAGLTVIDAEEQVLLELGRAIHARAKADETIKEMQQRLDGGKL